MNKKIAPPLILLLALAFTVASTTLSAPNQTLQVSFINVGQGDAALIQDNHGFEILIDGGPPAAGPTVVAYLREKGVDSVEVIVVSHAHLDHFGGLMSVLEASDISVGQIYYNGYDGTTTSWYAFATAVHNEGLTLTSAQFPGEQTWGSSTAYILGPEAGLINIDHNEASVVLLLEHGNNRFLFTGDLGFSGEAAVVARGTPVVADVLKVGHHGSNYSSSEAFLSAVSPSVGVISVGTNTYGHPADDALERLGAAGVQVWRTDLTGTIVVNMDGETFTIVPEFDVYKLYLPLTIRGGDPDPVPGWTLVSLTSPIGVNNTARLEIQTFPNILCNLQYYTPSGNKSTAAGLGDTTSDSGGRCVWEWLIGPRTTPGEGQLHITADGKYEVIPIVITD
jgi:competence protein ComEC